MKPLPTAQHGRHPQEPFWPMDNVSSRGPDLTAAPRGDRDQVTPALACGATVAQLTHGNPRTPAVPAQGGEGLVSRGRDRPGATGLHCSPKRDCSHKAHCTTRQGGSGERAASGSREGWRNGGGALQAAPLGSGLVTGISGAGPVPRDTHPSRAPWQKHPVGEILRKVVSILGSGVGQGCSSSPPGREPGAEMTFVILL